MKGAGFYGHSSSSRHGSFVMAASQERLAKRASALMMNNSVEDASSTNLAHVRSFMDPTESCLLDAILSTRIVNPEKSICELHFACAEVLTVSSSNKFQYHADRSCAAIVRATFRK